MKKNFTKSILFIAAGLMAASNLWADADPCNIAPASPQEAGTSTAIFTWSTADNGDVVVTITSGEGTTTASFRNDGFTGDVDQFKVLSGEEFATEENASKYFREKSYVDGESTYTLYRTGNYNLPSPCKIKYYHGALEWKTTVEETTYGNAYDNSSDYVYEYGTLCGSTLDAPVVSVSSAGVVTFDAVSGADTYKAYVYKGSEFIKKCPVTSGDQVYNPVLAGEYAIYVRAFNSSTDAYSDFSNAAIWDAAGDPAGDMPKSTVCDYFLREGTDEEALLSFYTDRSTGNFYITVRAGANGDDSKTFFRDAGGMDLSGFRYDGNTFTDYFTRTIENNDDINGKVNTLEFVPRTDEGHIPEYGHTITFLSGNYVTWRTYNNGSQQNPWASNLSFTYTYGANCNEIDDHVAATMDVDTVSTTTTSATLQIDVTDKNDYNEARAIRSLTIRDAAHDIAEQKVVLDGSNQVTLSELKKNTTYNFTVKVIDSGGNVTEETIKVPLRFDATENLAFKRTCSAGGAADPATQANDGNKGTHWGTYGLGDYGTKNYWTVTLDEAYVLNNMSLYAGDYGGGAAHKVTLQGKMREEDAWSDIITDMTVAGGSDNENIAINAAAKYLKVSAAADENWMFAIDEFEVYGTDYAVPDAVDPVVEVTEISKTYNTVTLQIDATDKDDAGDDGTINAINISGDNGFETQNNVTLDGSNQITLSGLHYNKTYTFTVQAIDLAGNEGTADIEVVLPFNTSYNIALDGTASAGYRENDSQTADKANDGSTSTKWNTYGVDASEGGYANNWWAIQLDAAYNLSSVVANYQDVGTRDFIIEGSMDGSNWYTLYKGQTTTAGEFSYDVAAPAQYVRYTYGERYLAVYEFEVYASGFSTLTDAQPVITYTKVGTVEDATAEIEIDAVDITTKPITKYMVSGLGGDPVEYTASEGKITLTSLSQSTHYTVEIQAKDGSGNLSAAKEVEFTTTGSVSGLYLHSDLYGWDLADSREQFSTTAVPGVMSYTANFSANTNHIYKLYNADITRCTWGQCGGESDHNFRLESATDVTFYATDEDHFLSTIDNLYLRGSLVGDDQALTWNDAHTIATWKGTLDLSGTKQFTIVKKNQVGETLHVYDHDFYTEAQTFDGDYTYGEFTLDVTKMTGTWDYVGLSFADDATTNSSVITANDGRIANVTINRDIRANDGWYTLCLPFDMSAEKVTEVFGSSKIAELKNSEDRGSLIHLNFDYVSAIEAGKAYLFKPGNNFTAGTIIEGVTIKNVTPVVSGDEYMHFQGTYDQTVLTDDNIRFVAEDDYLYSPAAGGTTMGAFRCYFTIPAASPAPGKRAKIVVGTQVVTDIESVYTSTLPVQKVLSDGQLLIIRDGRTYNAQGTMIK